MFVEDIGADAAELYRVVELDPDIVVGRADRHRACPRVETGGLPRLS